MSNQTKLDILAAMQRDPAAKSKFLVYFTYGGVKALRMHRRANYFYRHKMTTLAFLIAAHAKRLTGIDIHPAATFGQGVFIDHGVGVVIGETCQIGNNVTIYQGVTLGGTGKETGKRHPTVQDNVMISSGAKILGAITIGEGSKIGAGSVVLKDVPPHSTVVGVPGRIVRMHNQKVADFDQQNLPDPILQEFARLNKRVCELEEHLGIRSCKYSIVNNEVDNEVIQSTAKDISDKKN